MSDPVISAEDVAAALVSMVRDGLRPHDQEILIYGSKQRVAIVQARMHASHIRADEGPA